MPAHLLYRFALKPARLKQLDLLESEGATPIETNQSDYTKQLVRSQARVRPGACWQWHLAEYDARKASQYET
jgi:hypothetical protein